MDRAKLVAFHRDHYRPNNAFLLIVGAIDPDAMIAAAEKAFGGWARGEVAAPAYPAPPALSGRHVYFVQRPNSIQSSIAVGNIARQAQRSALVRADAGQHDLRRRVQLAHRPQHPRGEGLHLFAAVGDDRVRRRRLLPLLGRRAQRGHRPDARPRCSRRSTRCAPRAVDGAELQGAKAYLRGIFPIQTATQTGLSATLNNVYVFGLPKDYPETFRAKIAAVTPEQVKSGVGDAARIGELGDRDRRRLGEGEGSARRLQGHHVPRYRRQDDPAAAVTTEETAETQRPRRTRFSARR